MECRDTLECFIGLNGVVWNNFNNSWISCNWTTKTTIKIHVTLTSIIHFTTTRLWARSRWRPPRRLTREEGTSLAELGSWHWDANGDDTKKWPNSSPSLPLMSSYFYCWNLLQDELSLTKDRAKIEENGATAVFMTGPCPAWLLLSFSNFLFSVMHMDMIVGHFMFRAATQG